MGVGVEKQKITFGIGSVTNNNEKISYDRAKFINREELLVEEKGYMKGSGNGGKLLMEISSGAKQMGSITMSPIQ